MPRFGHASLDFWRKESRLLFGRDQFFKRAQPLFVAAASMAGVCAASSAFALEDHGAITVEPLLRTTTSWDGAPLRYPEGQAEITGLVVTIAPGGETGWHRHPVPSFGMLLSGELEITLRSGEVKRLRAGEALAEVVDTWHNGRAVGPEPARLLVFYAGAVGQALTER